MIELIILIIIIFEISIFLLFKYFKKNFQWFIELKDANPNFSKKIFDKYNNKILNKTLGWDNIKSKKNVEIIIKRKKFLFEYNFDKNGSRLTGNNFKKKKIAFFGDSYAFCRCSQDNQTIQHFLEHKTKSKILNYGVGNYGLDQVFLKIKKKNIKNVEHIIVVFVPETISRVHSYWKHFLEFGNTLAFKPKYEIKNDKLKLYRKHVKKLSKRNIDKNIEILKKKDVFFEKKFKKYIFKFPYFLSFVKKFNKNSKIFYYLFLSKVTKNTRYWEKAFSVIVEDNLSEAQKYYGNRDYNYLLEKIILEINSFIKKKNKKVYFFIIPQLFDLKLFNKINNSEKFYKYISKKNSIKLFDFTRQMSKIKNIENYYFDDFYGGHLNNKGNKFIANKIYKTIGKLI